MNKREEEDKFGKLTLDENELYGIQTKRALSNFNISNDKVSLDLIYAMIKVKKAAALANEKLNLLDRNKANAIVDACNIALTGKYNNQFLTNSLQGGAGTSTNMNVNEVISNLVLMPKLLPEIDGEYTKLKKGLDK